MQDRDQCFAEFDPEVTKPVREERLKRLANENQQSPGKKSASNLKQ